MCYEAFTSCINTGLLGPFDELIPSPTCCYLPYLSHRSFTKNKKQENIWKIYRTYKVKCLIVEVKNNFNKFSELSVSFIYACLQLLI